MHTLYTNPCYYEIAFSFRDIPAEVDCFETLMKQHSRIPVTRVLEVACGNAPHLEEFVQRGYAYTGIDCTQEMLNYTQAKAKRLHAPIELICANLADFRLHTPVDFAYIALGSLYIKNTAEMIAHFDAVGKALKPGGLYVLDWCVQFTPFVDHQETWSMERDGIKVQTMYSAKVLNCIEQTVEERITLQANDHGQSKTLQETSIKRVIFPQEFLLFIAQHPELEFVGWWNNWDLAKPLVGVEKINRPIIALRRKERHGTETV